MQGCRALSEAELIQVTQAFTGPDALRNEALCVVGHRTGFRISEFLNLTVGDVWQQGQVVTHVTVRRRQMKRHLAERVVRLHPEAQDALAWLTRWQRGKTLHPSQVLFPSSRKGTNRPITWEHANTILQQAFRACGLTGPLGTHSLRKTFALRFYQQSGGNLLKLQRALGHK
ncbi:MAG: tyrosine-type recombinase/integrase [Candidatus Entotheonellia bacterium]